MSPLLRLLMPQNDPVAAHRDMLAGRAATTFRNVGPKDLRSMPDRNSYQPNDTMSYLSMLMQLDRRL